MRKYFKISFKIILYGAVGMLTNPPEIIVSNLEKWLNLLGFNNFPDFMHTSWFSISSSLIGWIIIAYIAINFTLKKLRIIYKKQQTKQTPDEIPQYISLQEAGKFIYQEGIEQIGKEQFEISLDNVESILDPFEQMEQGKVDKSTPLDWTLKKSIEFILHCCRDNEMTLYGQRPFSELRIKIDSNDIKNFNVPFTKIYENEKLTKDEYINLEVNKKELETMNEKKLLILKSSTHHYQ